MVFNRFSRLLTTPIWSWVLISMVPWCVSFIAQYSETVAKYRYALVSRFELWEWMALVCAMWAMLVSIGFVELPKHPKRSKVLDFPDFLFICSRLLPPSDYQVQVLLPCIRTEYFFHELLEICKTTTAVGKKYQSFDQ